MEDMSSCHKERGTYSHSYRVKSSLSPLQEERLGQSTMREELSWVDTTANDQRQVGASPLFTVLESEAL